MTKFNANGSAFVYSTYLGGSGADSGMSIAVDSAGNAYVTGPTNSTDFPTANAIQPDFGGVCDAFVTKINASGTALLYSTYLGGSDNDMGISGGGTGGGIAIDTAGNAYVTGATLSTDFPTVNAIQPANHGLEHVFVTKVNSDGSALAYSTYLGVYSHDYAGGIAADAAGSAYLAGETYSKNFPTTPLAYQQSKHAGTYNYYDAFVSKIASQTFLSIYPAKLIFSPQVLGTGSAAKEISLTNQSSGTLTINKIYIGGLDPSDFAQSNTCTTLTSSSSCTISVTFTPTTKDTRQAVLGISDSDPASPQTIALTGTVTVVLRSPTFLRFGNQAIGTTSQPETVTLKNLGSTTLVLFISISGVNASDFSQTNTCGTSIAGGASCTITVAFTPTAEGTRKAAMSIGDNGGGSPQRVSLTGTGTSMAVTATTLSSLPNPSVYGQAVTFTATVTSSSGAPPDGETITFMKGTTVLGTGVLSGGSASFTTSTLPAGTNYIKAVYGGDSNFGPSTSKAVQQVVNLYPSHTRLTSTPNPSLYGQPVTLTATVTSAGPAPTGTVTFRMGTFVMGSPTLNSSGELQL